jgi:hypothetical protein
LETARGSCPSDIKGSKHQLACTATILWLNSAPLLIVDDLRPRQVEINTAAFQPTFYRRLSLRQPTNSIGVAMMKLPSVRIAPQNKKWCVGLSK